MRPLLTGESLTVDLVQRGVIALGWEIDLGRCEFRQTPQYPEVEDCYIRKESIKPVRRLSGKDFFELLAKYAKGTLFDIFGDSLQEYQGMAGTTMVVPQGQGKASLGDIWVSDFELKVRQYGEEYKLRGCFSVKDVRLSVAVTDLRFYKKEDFSLDIAAVKSVERSLKVSEVILSLGLSRAKKGFHWLQVNGVHLKNSPLWGYQSYD